MDAFGIIHLGREPPAQRAGFALPFAFDIDRHHVVEAHEFGEPIGRDVVLIRIDEIQFDLAAFKLHLCLVLVDRLE